MRRTLARLLAAAVIAAGLVPVLGGAAWACSCVADPADVGARALEAARVYHGTIVSTTQLSGGAVPSLAYTVEVADVLKGEVPDLTRISSPASEAACGISLRNGPVLVIDRTGDSNLNLCGGTTQKDVPRNAAAVTQALLAPSPSPTPSAEHEVAVAHEDDDWQTPLATTAAAILIPAVMVLVDIAKRGKLEGSSPGH